MFRIFTSVTLAPTSAARTGTKRCCSPTSCSCVHQIAAIGPVGRADVVHLQPGDEADQQVRGAGRPSPQDPFPPVVPPAAHQVVAFFDLVQEERQVLRKVLQVGVHRDDEIAARGGQAGLQRGGLAEVAPELDDAEPGLGRDQGLGDVERSVRAAIVDEDELEAIAPLESSAPRRRDAP